MTHNLILIFLLVLAAGLSVYEDLRANIHGGGYNTKKIFYCYLFYWF